MLSSAQNLSLHLQRTFMKDTIPPRYLYLKKKLFLNLAGYRYRLHPIELFNGDITFSSYITFHPRQESKIPWRHLTYISSNIVVGIASHDICSTPSKADAAVIIFGEVFLSLMFAARGSTRRARCQSQQTSHPLHKHWATSHRPMMRAERVPLFHLCCRGMPFPRSDSTFFECLATSN